VWARCGVSGKVYDFQIYTVSGSGSDNYPNLGVGGNVVQHMTSSLPKNVGHKVYFDHYFSSVYLLQFLKAVEIWAVGTIRTDRLKGGEKVLHD
jgi:hypothetical protein